VAGRLRPGKPPGDVEGRVRAHLRRLIRHISRTRLAQDAELRSVATGTMLAGGDDAVREQRHDDIFGLSGTMPSRQKK